MSAAPFAQRFLRQTRFAPLGAPGQERLERSSVLLVGCGALGGSLAQMLVRAGVGRLVLVDRDIVEESNLPRQVLFDERHAAQGAPKALAAAESLARIGGPTRVEAHVRHVDAPALRELAQGVELILDGTDNLPTRYLINDFCVERGLPWIYAGVVGAHGLVLPILPGQGACLVCLFPEPAPAGTLDSCETAGVILPAVAAVAALQAAAALRLLSAGRVGFEAVLLEIDVWNSSVQRLLPARDPDCPCCGRREFRFLYSNERPEPVSLCGRNTVQIAACGAAPSLDLLAQRLAGVAGGVVRAGPLLRFELDGLRATVFADGRALIEGTEDVARARAFHDRMLGA